MNSSTDANLTIKNFLKPEQVHKLQQALRESEPPPLRERILMFLLQNGGKTYEEITIFLGCSPRKVAYWCVHGDPDNLESLRNQREQGNRCSWMSKTTGGISTT